MQFQLFWKSGKTNKQINFVKIQKLTFSTLFQAAYSTDKAMGHNCELYIIDVRHLDSNIGDSSPIIRLPMNNSKITSMLWFLDETIITGHENGQISIWDLRVSFFLINKTNDLN